MQFFKRRRRLALSVEFKRIHKGAANSNRSLFSFSKDFLKLLCYWMKSEYVPHHKFSPVLFRASAKFLCLASHKGKGFFYKHMAMRQTFLCERVMCPGRSCNNNCVYIFKQYERKRS